MPLLPTTSRRQVLTHALSGALCLLGLASLPTSARAGSTDWEAVREGRQRDDISTWVRRVEGMDVKAFKGVTEVHQSTLSVLALLADIPGLSHWVFHCIQSGQPAGFTPDHTYARFRGIWPASDRDVLFRSTVSQLGNGDVLVDSREVAGYPAQDGFVRMPYLHNTFTLTPLPGQWTRVTFETQIDLGGLVPTWLANLVSTDAPLVTLQGLQKQVGQARYQVQSVKDLPAYYLQGSPISLPAAHLQP